MTQAYSNPERETEETALPDIEVFYLGTPDIKQMVIDGAMEDECEPGWFYWFCFPGCLPDSEPMGPFDTEADALADARNS